MNIILAVILGTLFGFVLQRTGAADPAKILGMLRLKDPHLARTILSGIGVSAVLLSLGLLTGLVDPAHLSVKSLYYGVLVGGAVFGVGWAISGFCPGTAVAALGSGQRQALSFVLGGLVGAGIFIKSFGLLKETRLYTTILGGKVTLAPAGKFHSLAGDGMAGGGLALGLGLALIILAWKLPKPGKPTVEDR